MSSYHLSNNDTLFLNKAVDLADRLLPAFDTSSGVPQAMSNLGEQIGIYDFGHGGLVSTAEVTTLQLEFRYLSHLTGDYKYWDKAEKVRVFFFHYGEATWLIAVVTGYEDYQGLDQTNGFSSHFYEVR